jgi:hypothetical protein
MMEADMGRAERFPIRAKVRLATKDESAFAQTRDMSSTGIFIEQKDAVVDVGKTVELIVYNETKSTIVRTDAEVVRVGPEGFGARFTTATPAGRTELEYFLANFPKS